MVLTKVDHWDLETVFRRQVVARECPSHSPGISFLSLSSATVSYFAFAKYLFVALGKPGMFRKLHLLQEKGKDGKSCFFFFFSLSELSSVGVSHNVYLSRVTALYHVTVAIVAKIPNMFTIHHQGSDLHLGKFLQGNLSERGRVSPCTVSNFVVDPPPCIMERDPYRMFHPLQAEWEDVSGNPSHHMCRILCELRHSIGTYIQCTKSTNTPPIPRRPPQNPASHVRHAMPCHTCM